MRHASLPMYDADPVSVGGWWQAIAELLRAEGVAGVPQAIAWPDDLEAHWHEPDLLLSQTCGYPLVTRLFDVVQVVGAFRYTAPGASGIQYRSALVTRVGDAGRRLQDYRGRRVALNALDSYSGWHALRASLAAHGGAAGFFGEEVLCGSHRASLAAVQTGRADIAAIDCITLAGLRLHAPHLLERLATIGHTDAAPGLPLVTSRHTSPADVAALRRALDTASRDPVLADIRKALFIGGFVAASSSAWERIRKSGAPAGRVPG